MLSDLCQSQKRHKWPHHKGQRGRAQRASDNERGPKVPHDSDCQSWWRGQASFLSLPFLAAFLGEAGSLSGGPIRRHPFPWAPVCDPDRPTSIPDVHTHSPPKGGSFDILRVQLTGNHTCLQFSKAENLKKSPWLFLAWDSKGRGLPLSHAKGEPLPS